MRAFPLLMRNESSHREELERAALRSIEAHAGRPFTDEEWPEARRNLLALARLVVGWKLNREFMVLAGRLSPDDPPREQPKRQPRRKQ